MPKSYDKLTVLSELEHIRKRPGMYIGETDDPTHLANELIDNALDEAAAGHASVVTVVVQADLISVSDNGRGIPQGKDKKTGEYFPIISATKLHSSGKFDKEAYGISIGLNGIGLVACNALSSAMSISTCRDGKYFSVNFKNGVPEKPSIQAVKSKESNTSVTVWPSSEFFASTRADIKRIKERLVLAASFIEGVEIFLNEKKIKPKAPTEFLSSDVPVFIEAESEIEGGQGAICFLGYSDKISRKDTNFGSVNLLPVNFGAHIRVMEKAVKKAWESILPSEVSSFLQEDDVLCGLRGFIYAKIAEPSYTSQTKDTLAASSLKGVEADLVSSLALTIRKKLKKLPEKVIRGLIQKFTEYRESQNKLVSKKYIDSAVIMGDEGHEVDRSLKRDTKLIDCTSSNREGTELYVIEGDSAGSGLIPMRNPKKHAILPLRGKTLNVVGKEISRILDNLEIRSLINAMGTGCLHKEDTSRFRYSKVIIATDSDVDGLNIRALILGALAYLTPGLVRSKSVYIVTAPLFGQYTSEGEFIPVWNMESMTGKLKTMRFKGLGSMSPQEVAQSVLDPKNRRLIQVTMEDATSVIDLVGNPEARKEMLTKKGLIEE